jgi:excisionase family DNA binding protein
MEERFGCPLRRFHLYGGATPKTRGCNVADSDNIARQQIHDDSSPLSQHRTLDDLPFYLTVDEWRDLLRIGRSKAYELLRSGAVPHVRHGKIIRIPRSAVQV